VNQYAAYVEYIIISKKIRHLLLVGVHAASSSDGIKYDIAKDSRAFEYNDGFAKFVKGSDSTIFQKHLEFFCKEVPEYIQKRYNVSALRSAACLFGYSNGASFTVSAGLYHPEAFSNIISCSVSWLPALKSPQWDAVSYPRYYLGAGSLEPEFYDTTQKWAKLLNEAGKQNHLYKYRAGHDEALWKYFFIETIQKIFATAVPAR